MGLTRRGFKIETTDYCVLRTISNTHHSGTLDSSQSLFSKPRRSELRAYNSHLRTIQVVKDHQRRKANPLTIGKLLRTRKEDLQ